MSETPADPISPLALRRLLTRYGIRPSRVQGQSFLVDGQLRERLIAAAQLRPGETVLEIGSGLGTLTLALSQRDVRVVAVEKDPRCVAALGDLLPPGAPVELHKADALRAPLEEWLAAAGEQPVAVVSNLPYSVSKPLLQRLVGLRHPWRLMVLTLQREVAERLTARPGEKAYGPLTLSIQVRAEAELLFEVPSSAFHPQPAVRSSALALHPLAAARVPPELEQPFFRVVHAAFRSRRKTLLNALSGGLARERGRVEALLLSLGIDPGLRGERLDLEAFRRIAEAITERPEDESGRPRTAD